MEHGELLVCSCVCSSTLSYVGFFPLKNLRLQISHKFQVISSFQSRQRRWHAGHRAVLKVLVGAFAPFPWEGAAGQMCKHSIPSVDSHLRASPLSPA